MHSHDSVLLPSLEDLSLLELGPELFLHDLGRVAVLLDDDGEALRFGVVMALNLFHAVVLLQLLEEDLLGLVLALLQLEVDGHRLGSDDLFGSVGHFGC